MNRIRSQRERAGMTLTQLAIKAGLTPDYLRQLEDGEEELWLIRLKPIADALGVTVEDLLPSASPRPV
ncbi:MULTISPECIES: helix-turn-helix domain-containing protein, partial [Pseudomonadota]|jgi:transcriptional regulator with XRE-family HTH domain|uniref:helix-turn-helix domain-containing protein n=1 Tax=Pseudomonadota TaxID=1224 RepID=UPI000CC2D722